MIKDPPISDVRISKMIMDVQQKNWLGRYVENMREMALGADEGDIVVNDGGQIVNLVPGPFNYVLTAWSRTIIPNWTYRGI